MKPLPTLLLVQELTEQVLSHINDDASFKCFSRYLLEAMGDDFEIATQMLRAFDDGQHQNPLQIKLKAFIQMKIKKSLSEGNPSK